MTDRESKDEKRDIDAFLRVIYKRRWFIISFFAITLLVTLIYDFSATPFYQATSRLEIFKENPNLISIQEVMAVDATGSDYYQTQYQIIKSRAVARKVIQALHLEDNPEFSRPRGGIENWIRTVLNTGKSNKTDGGQDRSPDSELVTQLIGRISVTPIRNSRLVDISVRAKDPVMAAGMTDAVVEAYIDHNLETKLSAAKNAVQWLSDRIAEQRKKVEKAEAALLKFKEESGIITSFSSDTEQITAQKLAQLNSQVIDAEAQRVEAETRYLQSLKLKNSPDMLDSIPEVIDNPLVSEIKKMEINLYTKMSELSKKYGRNHPKMVAIRLELEDLKKRKKAAVNQIISSLKNEYELALARADSLKKALTNQKNESLRMNKMAIQYGVLQREAQSTKNMYNLLVNRFKETSLTEEMKTGNIRVIDKAEVPGAPISPRTMMNILLAIAVGLSFGIGLALLIEFLDNTVKSPEDIKESLGIPLLTAVPAFSTNKTPEGIPGEMVTHHSKKSIASEAFQGLRTGVLFSSAEAPPQAIMVTSAGIKDGKTVIALNLAITMAQAGTETVLVDFDMRRPQIHTFFKVDGNVGLSNLLVGTAKISEGIHPSGIEGLDIIPCGTVPPNPSELISAKNTKQLIGILRKKYKSIIIDTPPMLAISDAVALTPLVDGTILAIRAGETPRKIIQSVVEKLKGVNGRILGAVLNGIVYSHDSYYYQQYADYYDVDEGLASFNKNKRSAV